MEFLNANFVHIFALSLTHCPNLVFVKAFVPLGLIGRFLGLAFAGDSHNDDEDCSCDRTFSKKNKVKI